MMMTHLCPKLRKTPFYAPYDAKKTNDLNVVTIPVTDVSDGQSVSVTVNDEAFLNISAVINSK